MLLSHLVKLRSQPKAVRNRYALIYSASFTALIALVWFSTGAMIRSSQVDTTVVKNQASVFSSFVSEAKNQWANALGSISKTAEVDTDGLQVVNASGTQAILLSPEDIALAQSRLAATTSLAEEVTEPEEVMIIVESELNQAGTSRE